MPVAQTMPVVCANGFPSHNRVPELPGCPLVAAVFCPPVSDAAAVVVVVENVGSTNFVAFSSQLKHAVSSGNPVPTNVVDRATDAVLTRATSSEAPASRPKPISTTGTMCVSCGKTCERSPFRESEDIKGSQWALTPLREEILTVTVGRSRNRPAYMVPAPERTLTPRRTELRRPRERVRLRTSEEAANGVAVIVELELEGL